jgi:hypothetical protein
MELIYNVEKDYGMILKKNEESLLKELKENFLSQFVISEEEYDDLIIGFDGTIEELYYYVRKTFDHSLNSRKKRGRPKKNCILK